MLSRLSERVRQTWVLDTLVLVLPALVLLAVVVSMTAEWRMRHDLPMMMYQAFLIDKFGWLPYRDFFDMNMPGTYLTYLGIGKVFGYTDTALRTVDFLWMAAVGASTVLLLRLFPKRIALLAVPLFLLRYLKFGGDMTLQREFLALLPLGFTVFFATWDRPSIAWRAWLAGLGLGLCATFKPHLLVGVLPVAAYVAYEGHLQRPEGRWRPVAKVLVLGALGVLTPLGVAAAGMAHLGVLDNFIENSQYLYYYGHLTRDHDTIEGVARLKYLFSELVELGGNQAWFFGAAFGFFVALGGPYAEPGPRRREVVLLAGLTLAYWLYPIFSGQFWNYHWLPAIYLSSIGISMALAPIGVRGAMEYFLPRAMVVVLLISSSDLGEGFQAYQRIRNHAPADGRTDEIAFWLRENTKPGERVQAFDWVRGGVVHAMLEARVQSATPFLYTFHFYHHVSTPYIDQLRRRFLRELHRSKPEFIVESRAHWPFTGGDDSSAFFLAYDVWRDAGYTAAETGKKYTIYERNDHLAERVPYPPDCDISDQECDPSDPAYASLGLPPGHRVGGLSMLKEHLQKSSIDLPGEPAYSPLDDEAAGWLAKP